MQKYQQKYETNTKYKYCCRAIRWSDVGTIKSICVSFADYGAFTCVLLIRC